MDPKLEIHNFAVDGRIKDIQEDYGNDRDLVTWKELSFTYHNKKLNVSAKVTFFTHDKEVDLYVSALKFIKRLK